MRRLLTVIAAMLILLSPVYSEADDKGYEYRACTPGESAACGSNIGACTLGISICDENGEWGVCTGGTGPSEETCNSIDDNCNGLVDEGNVCLSTLTPACAEEWTCSEWLPCLNSTESRRVCSDLNSCNTTRDKPATEKQCFEESFFEKVQAAAAQTAGSISALAKEKSVFSYAVIILILVFMFLAWLLSVDRKKKNAVIQDGGEKEENWQPSQE